MRIRLCAFAAAAGLAVAAFPAHAATPKPQITDPTGDANGINDQGLGLPIPSQGGPADFAAADITSVLFKTTFVTRTVNKKRVKVPTGFTVTLSLAAVPTVPNVIYRVAASATTCQTLFFEYSTAVNATTPGSARCAASLPAPSGPVTITSAIVKGKTVVWTVPIASEPKGTTLSGLNAQTRFVSGTPGVSLTAPQFDGAASTSTFTVGK